MSLGHQIITHTAAMKRFPFGLLFFSTCIALLAPPTLSAATNIQVLHSVNLLGETEPCG